MPSTRKHNISQGTNTHTHKHIANVCSVYDVYVLVKRCKEPFNRVCPNTESVCVRVCVLLPRVTVECTQKDVLPAFTSSISHRLLCIYNASFDSQYPVLSRLHLSILHSLVLSPNIPLLRIRISPTRRISPSNVVIIYPQILTYLSLKSNSPLILVYHHILSI